MLHRASHTQIWNNEAPDQTIIQLWRQRHRLRQQCLFLGTLLDQLLYFQRLLKRIVYVSRLATAPWNRADLQTPVEYRAVGSTLMRFAPLRSEELGYGGLVGVHSLSEAEAFYRKLNMADCNLDQDSENLRYFEWYRSRPSLMDELDL